MQVLAAKGIKKRFPGVLALDSVDFSIEQGEIHCLVGENGAGKSTLIKVLTGNYAPDEGNITIFGRNPFSEKLLFRKISYVPQEIDLFFNLSVAENLILPYNSQIYKKRMIKLQQVYELAKPILRKYHINAEPEEKVGDISISEQQLIQIAHAVENQSAEIIMLDEPTTSLVSDDIERLFSVIIDLKKKGKAIVFISHKLEEVFAIGDCITILRNGQKIGDADIKNVSMEWVIEKMVGQELDPNAKYRPKCDINSKSILKVNNISGKGYKNISFEIKEGEILGFAGLVGSGRSEIVQGLIGYKPFWQGSFSFNNSIVVKKPSTILSKKLGILYLPEERKKQGIFPYLSVIQNISIMILDELQKGFFISNKKEKKCAIDLIKEYNIKTNTPHNKIIFLSGGNQQKVIIARAMRKRPKLLIFDEPTKGIDVGAKAEIYRLMKEIVEKYNISIILISSEIDEVIKCSNRILVLYRGQISGEFNADNCTRTEIISAMIGQINRNGYSLAINKEYNS
ncbi:TPA: sugar ABC transporter ATP-binding protein [Candidatus Poribacteria bacterium]|nr:sugar ABC transporter ATP-binding protein [Candidatus Poribacteria bacterium]